MKGFFAGMALLATAVSVHAQTTPPVLVWCNGCGEAQKQDLAKHQYSNLQTGIVYVGDLNIRSYTAYDVYTDIDDSHGAPPYPRIKYATATTPQSPYKDIVGAVIGYYYSGPVGWHKGIKIGTNGQVTGPVANTLTAPYDNPNVNVYDVINPGAAQNKLTDWVGKQAGTALNYASHFMDTLGASFKLVDLSNAPTIQIEIQFSDGSHITVNEDFSSTNPKMLVDETSGRDSHNNNVPGMTSNKNADIGTYDFDGPGNPTDYARWQQQMQWLGYTINTTTGGSAGGWHGWACVKTGSGENEVYTCTYY